MELMNKKPLLEAHEIKIHADLQTRTYLSILGKRRRKKQKQQNLFKSPWVQHPLQLSSAHRSKGTRPKASQGNHREDSQATSRAGRYHWNWMQNIFRLSLFTVFRPKVCLSHQDAQDEAAGANGWSAEEVSAVPQKELCNQEGNSYLFMDCATSQEEIPSFSNLTITNLLKKRGKEKVKATYHSNNLQVL